MRRVGIAVLAGGLSMMALSGAGAGADLASVTGTQRSYMVFFEDGSSTLSPTAAMNVRNAAKGVATAEWAYVIRLHGEDERITAVKAELVRQGIPGDAIIGRPTPRGLEGTGDGLIDPASRRVEIRF